MGTVIRRHKTGPSRQLHFQKGVGACGFSKKATLTRQFSLENERRVCLCRYSFVEFGNLEK